MHIIPHNLLSDERMWAHSCCLTPPHRSRTGTAGWGAWRMLWRVRERSRPSSPSQLWVAGPLSPYNVIIYLFCMELLLYSKMWHSILCHDSSYVWDLVPAHLVIMFAPGSWCPKIRVWQMVSTNNPRMWSMVRKHTWGEVYEPMVHNEWSFNPHFCRK